MADYARTQRLMQEDDRFILPKELRHSERAFSSPAWQLNAIKKALQIAGLVFLALAIAAIVPGYGDIAHWARAAQSPQEIAPLNPMRDDVINPIALTQSAPRLTVTHSDAEAMLLDAVLALRAGELNRAEAVVAKLLLRQPNYQLAHLLRADILQTRAGKPTVVGAKSGQRPEMAELVKELEARVAKLNEPAIDGRRPDMFVQLAPQVRFALAVDASRSRLYVLENAPMGPRRVLDVYATIGKSGSGKAKEGDKRTPTGVYLLQSQLDRTKLTDFYGEGAFALDYPNVLDKRAGRDGSGIWLHGVPKESFVRPPRSSDGCIVVSNDDLKLLTPYIQPGQTQIAIADAIRWIPAAQVSDVELSLRKSLEQWRLDWESRNHPRYMAHYASDFFSDKVSSREAWEVSRRSVTEQKTSVSVKLDNLTIAQIPNESETVMVMFDQRYKSDSADTTLKKRQFWQRDGKQWKIIYEGNA